MSDDRTVHVIDDDDAVRDSLTFLLTAAGFGVVAHESADAFLAKLGALRPACVITDVRMPGTSGIDLLKQLVRRGTEIPMIVVTGHGEIPLAVEAMKLGAVDFFEKPFEDAAILRAVRAAIDRQGAGVVADASKEEIRARIAALSAREKQVLDGIVAGRANKVIARDLGISPRTVEVYRAHVMTKMEAGSLPELVKMAFLAEG
jgi:two-component system response regulator FixJ